MEMPSEPVLKEKEKYLSAIEATALQESEAAEQELIELMEEQGGPENLVLDEAGKVIDNPRIEAAAERARRAFEDLTAAQEDHRGDI